MNEQALKDRLRAIANVENRTVNEVWRELVLERFLVRLSKSPHVDQLIFKGGMLLSHYVTIGRETKDADFLATLLNAEFANIEQVFRNICHVALDDGFTFMYSNITLLEQPHMNYGGFRVHLNLKYGARMKDRIQVDIGVGDVVDSKMESLELCKYKGKPIFEASVTLRVYPVETIFAEKLETIISKGAANSRMKDFHDLLLLCREGNLLSIPKLNSDLAATFQNRNTPLKLPVTFSGQEYEVLQQLWIAYRRGLDKVANELKIPDKIDMLIAEVNRWLTSKNLL